MLCLSMHRSTGNYELAQLGLHCWLEKDLSLIRVPFYDFSSLSLSLTYAGIWEKQLEQDLYALSFTNLAASWIWGMVFPFFNKAIPFLKALSVGTLSHKIPGIYKYIVVSF